MADFKIVADLFADSFAGVSRKDPAAPGLDIGRTRRLWVWISPSLRVRPITSRFLFPN